MYKKKPVLMLNLKIPINIMNNLCSRTKDSLFYGGIHTLEQLMELTDEQILKIPHIGKMGLREIQHAIVIEREISIALTKKLREEGYKTERSIVLMTLPQILDFYELSFEQIGRILRFQRDIGNLHYEHQELVHTTRDGRIYHCDHCRYRNPDANFCGFCTQMIKDDMETKRKK